MWMIVEHFILHASFDADFFEIDNYLSFCKPYFFRVGM